MVGHVARMGERRDAYRVWWGDPRERYHLENPGINERIILRFIFWKWNGGVNWIDLAQDRDRLQAVVNAVMNLRVP